MSVIVFAENTEGKFGKPVFEASSYANAAAQMLGTDVTAVSIGDVSDDELTRLYKYGVTKVLKVNVPELKDFSSAAYASVLKQAAEKENATLIVLSSTFMGKSLAARTAAKMQAGLVSNVNHLPETASGFVVKKSVYSGKGYGFIKMNSDKKIVTVAINSFSLKEDAKAGSIEAFSPTVNAAETTIKVTEHKRQTGKISLAEAEIVVSGGRGMKGPENWSSIEELAGILGAATACSKPVADIGWRPHAEHVGQTGLTISPNLYIAIGISGAIQHLAGVSSSKVIVAINKDAEAPFFKAATYGIVGDAFDVLPKLIAAARNVKSHS